VRGQAGNYVEMSGRDERERRREQPAGRHQEVMTGGRQGSSVELSIDRILELADWSGLVRPGGPPS
jgi:hypothetical protein